MPETCIRFGEHGARVMIEDKEIQNYPIHIDQAKKEVSCWIASEAGKVRVKSLFSRLVYDISCNCSSFSNLKQI